MKKRFRFRRNIHRSSPITSLDYDHDGRKDLLLCGNINHERLRFGKSDANYGTLLRVMGKGGFNYIPQKQSGFQLWGDIRNVLSLNNILLFAINQQEIKAYKLSKSIITGLIKHRRVVIEVCVMKSICSQDIS